MITIFDVEEEEYFGDNVYLIHRPHILSNPYTHIKDKQTQALYIVRNKEEAIEKYSKYFDTMYGHHLAFTKIFDEIYEKYRKGDDIFLGCYCKTSPCHGEVIINKLKSKLLKEKIIEAKKLKNIC
jgi:hypothetical protein